MHCAASASAPASGTTGIDRGEENVHGNAAPRAQMDVGAPARGGRDVDGVKGAGVAGGQGSSAASAAAAFKVGGDIESISDSEEDEEKLFAGNILGKRRGASADVCADARPRY